MPTPSNDTPTVVTVAVEKHTEVIIQDCKEYTFYINGQEYKKLPLDANVREPNTQKSKPYKAMMETLQSKPNDFFENNLGISVIATDIQKARNINNKEQYVLTFQSGTGILNGGHTQQAILDSKDNPNISEAIVRVSVRVKNYSLARIAEIASAQNSSTAVKEYTLAEKKGLFVPIKRALEENNEKHIIWWEGRQIPEGTDGMSPDDLIALINVFNINWYHSDYNQTIKNQPTNSSSSKANVFRRWENDSTSFEKIYTLVNDIIELSEYIQMNFHEKTGMARLGVIQEGKPKKLTFSGCMPAYALPKQFLFPLIASFRANIFYDETNRKIGWYTNNKRLFDNAKKSMCEKLMSFYRTSYSNNLNKAGRDPNLFEALYVDLNSKINKSTIEIEYEF